MDFWQITIKALGVRGALLLAVGSFGGILLSSVDLGFTLLLHSLFYKLGVQEIPSTEDTATTLQYLSTPALALALVGIGIARSLAFLILHNASATAHQYASVRLRLLHFYISLKKNASSPFSPGEVQHAIHEIYPKAALFYRQLAQTLGLSVYIVGLLAIMAYHTPWLTLIAAVGLALFFPIFARVRRKIQKSSEKIPQAHRQLMLGIEHISQNWLFLRVMRLLDLERSRIIGAALRLSHESLRISRANLLANAMVSISGVLTLVGAIFLGFLLESSPGVETAAFVYLFVRMVQSLATLISSGGALYAVRPQFLRCAQDLRTLSAHEIREALAEMRPQTDSRKTAAPGREQSVAAVLEPLAPPAIALNNLRFAYAADAPEVLDGLRLDIKPGEFCALVGESGSGKSTLIALIAGLLKPTSGQVTIAGQLPDGFFSGNSARVGFVGAVPYLVTGTIRDNLCLGLPFAPSDEALARALESAGIADRIATLPDGIEHLLLSGGEGLSSGEQQRLCLARALLGQPNIIFLDEISANLDPKTEEMIARSLSKLKGSCTMVFSTHGTTLLSLADQVVSLPRGDIREKGAHPTAPSSSSQVSP